MHYILLKILLIIFCFILFILIFVFYFFLLIIYIYIYSYIYYKIMKYIKIFLKSFLFLEYLIDIFLINYFFKLIGLNWIKKKIILFFLFFFFVRKIIFLYYNNNILKKKNLILKIRYNLIISYFYNKKIEWNNIDYKNIILNWKDLKLYLKYFWFYYKRWNFLLFLLKKDFELLYKGINLLNFGSIFTLNNFLFYSGLKKKKPLIFFINFRSMLLDWLSIYNFWISNFFIRIILNTSDNVSLLRKLLYKSLKFLFFDIINISIFFCFFFIDFIFFFYEIFRFKIFIFTKICKIF